ncbi:MAG: Holliday junction branch migration protein RuvA [Candidatus Kapabacteria bacterium]|nr:Holliday junction branch migration protein RuvA [Candidatus Kapabacteria bacterium]MDW8012252.1 Holliday junction branch migration protein RuvA [Bacteroidota bacterium]
MLAFVEGEVVQREQNAVIVNCGGIGLRITVPSTTAQRLPEVGQRVRLWTVLEFYQEPGGRGEFQLYGFATRDESQLFQSLRAVPGVGAKTALNILSAASVAELRQSILQGDVAVLRRLPGVGRKMAERLVVELRERIVEIADEVGDVVPAAIRQELTAALVALGFSRSEVERVVPEVLHQPAARQQAVEELLRDALARLRK